MTATMLVLEPIFEAGLPLPPDVYLSVAVQSVAGGDQGGGSLRLVTDSEMRKKTHL